MIYNSSHDKGPLRGFTIVEFMIATSVFGVVTLGVTAAVLYITRAYQHSLYTSQTQAAASNLVDAAAQAVKFSSSDIVKTGDSLSGTGTYCVGTRQFLYVIGKEIGGDKPETATRNAVMTRLTPESGCAIESITNVTPSGNPKELLGKGMRLAKFDIKPSTPPMWVITARVVYGSDDLLCSPSVVDSCASGGELDATGLQHDDLMCKDGAGSEFCAVSELSTTVYRRL